MKTAKEILKEFGSIASPFNGVSLYNEKQVLEAMEEYASQFSQAPVIDREGAIKQVTHCLENMGATQNLANKKQYAITIVDSLIQSGYINKGWVKEKELLIELIGLQKEYSKLLGGVVDSNASFLYAHGITETEERVELGKQLRMKIEIAEIKLSALTPYTK